MNKEKVYEYKKIKSRGAVIHLIKYQDEDNWKMHSWDGPSIEPKSKDCEFDKSWHINGIEYSQEEWEDRIRERTGVPPHKQSGLEEVR